MSMADPFLSRMAHLDTLVEQCRGEGAFATGVVHDTSNRTSRDWPWWSTQIERTDEDVLEKRRSIAEISLNSPAPGIPSVFEARWTARIWQGVSVDSFTEGGNWSLEWDDLSAKDLNDAMSALLAEAEAAIARGRKTGGSGH